MVLHNLDFRNVIYHKDDNIILCNAAESGSEEKPVFAETVFCADRGREEEELPVTILAKDSVGIRNIKQIFSLHVYDRTGYGDLVYYGGQSYSWDDIVSRREGLLIGMNCNWAFIRGLVSGGYKDAEVRHVLENRYKNADYVELRPGSLMHYIYDTPKEDEDGRVRESFVRIGKDEGIRMVGMAARIVGYLKEMGKTVIAYINTCSIDKNTLKEYEYLGSGLAEGVVLKNPYLIEAQLKIADVCFQEDGSVIVFGIV